MPCVGPGPTQAHIRQSLEDRVAATLGVQGIVMRAVGDKMVVSPPLVISKEQIDELVDIAWRCLDLTLRQIS